MKRVLQVMALVIISLSAKESQAQNQTGKSSMFDTVRRMDANGWEFMQVSGEGAIWSEGNLHNGIREGVWSSYWNTGYPRNMTSYINGLRTGPSLEIDVTGFILEVDNYKDDLLEGPQRMFQKGSVRMTEETYFSKGKKEGSYKKWYFNGNLQETSNYSDDKRDGQTVFYFEDGSKAGEYMYSDGLMDGDATTYYPNGKVSDVGTFKKDLQSGDWKEYYENGNMKAEGKYADGDKQGPWKEYDEGGNYKKTVRYEKGEEK
ncbi:MAG TPA: hypothetical protein VN721_16185 [Flavipsychrobacter sp.]|nr:hypothetical protein [Flavipsychrobacter sp.]